MARYSNDPRWFTARYAGKCGGKGCGAEIRKGDDVFYYPSTKTALGSRCECGQAASADFEAAKADEAMESGGY